jgi:ATP-binding cassette, subfamily B, bacterial CvaB/MchF/RaxB
VDGALVSGDKDLLLLTVLGGGVLIVVQFLLSMARGWIGLRMNQQLSIQFTANLFSHLLKLPLSFFEKRHIGDITSRFGSLHAIRGVLTGGAVSGLLDGVMAIVTLGMMFLFSPMLTGVVLVALLLYFGLRWASYAAFRDANEERIVLSAKENSFFLETVRAAQPLKLFNRAPERLARWQNLMVDVQNRDLTTQKMELWFSTANTLIFGIEGMLILYLGGTAVLGQQMTLGMLLAFMAYKAQFGGRATALINLAMQIKMLSLHAERLADIALEKPEKESAYETDIERIAPRIEVRNLSFRYAEGEPWVLRDCSLTIEAGEHVAIVGASGCGKSTLLKLILGLVEPTEGDIRIGERGATSIKQLGPNQFRALIGTVMQNDTLLAGSIAENIACFDPQIDYAKVEAVAKLAQVHDEIVAMPMGYQTLVGDMGDEATSALDSDNERKVNHAIRALPLTRITIAHRAETIASAHRVIELANGAVLRELRNAA